MKTIREWLEELPDGYSERAIRNTEEVILREYAGSLSQALVNAFIWYYTDEGDKFWAGVNAKVKGIRDDWPPIPDTIPDPILERFKRIEAKIDRLTELLDAERGQRTTAPQLHECQTSGK